MPNEINKENLLSNGFTIDFENKDNGVIYLTKDVVNWKISCCFDYEKLREIVIESDGGYENKGEFQLNFTSIEQIDNLINAMLG